MARPTDLTGNERFFDDDELIVSKTNLTGHITYANRVFLKISGYTESEILGAPHSLIRHPHMPRAVFKLLWDTIKSGQEIFAYVVNRSKNGDHYWVFAHVTPTFNDKNQIIGYHSNRRTPDRRKLAKVEPIYRRLVEAESHHRNPKDQIAASTPLLQNLLTTAGITYEELVFSL